jgi:hypothetical protein
MHCEPVLATEKGIGETWIAADRPSTRLGHFDTECALKGLLVEESRAGLEASVATTPHGRESYGHIVASTLVEAADPEREHTSVIERHRAFHLAACAVLTANPSRVSASGSNRHMRAFSYSPWARGNFRPETDGVAAVAGLMIFASERRDAADGTVSVTLREKGHHAAYLPPWLHD